ncbi:hypothetical protein M231_01707 [Tremella mesenterica]|uniref:RING-type domain-containing protein n=1 Tax=Tremella mesenterica TaxID=5217 RepID=A0A4Q1BSW5_TREME|nr:hypothetical protein M231_01707 [Tremella mesenterica]
MPPHPRNSQNTRSQHSPYFIKPPSKASQNSLLPSSLDRPQPLDIKINDNHIYRSVSQSDNERKKRRKDKKRKPSITTESAIHRAHDLAMLGYTQRVSQQSPRPARMISDTRNKPSTPPSPGINKSKSDDHRVQILQRKFELSSREAKRREEELEETITRLESKLAAQTQEVEAARKDGEKHRQQAAEHAKTIEEHVATKDSLKEAITEAASCLICCDTLKDPHILSCGHIACKGCLQTWFRSSGAYIHGLPDDVRPELDLSYRSKVCHVCRTSIIRRPTRLYVLGDLLQPVGIQVNLPAASQEPADPWRLTFPRDRENYRMYDSADGVYRCPECMGEIDGDYCHTCDAKFSTDEEGGMEGDFDGMTDEDSLGFPEELRIGSEEEYPMNDIEAFEAPLNRWAQDEVDWSDHDEEYEDSFIDDGEIESEREIPDSGGSDAGSHAGEPSAGGSVKDDSDGASVRDNDSEEENLSDEIIQLPRQRARALIQQIGARRAMQRQRERISSSPEAPIMAPAPRRGRGRGRAVNQVGW